ncbi:tRNA preQ1(34) S-adenosylmethionine ribosyltransferase-isomerase QueA [Bacteroides sedimenti]|uniref:S-adenosylmethionine:tRNA ribosyltransferase-isomerase n=1 Tax=Bacteroides sedimenti TaxID=2136147 RepID=A0ABM8IE59_9BACE
MKLSQFKFKLPEDRIALHPAKYRDESRLMVLHKKTGEIEHKVFKDVLDYFDDKDVFIFNDTKVFPARLYGNKEKTGARIEVFLLRELNQELRLWDVLVDPARKIRIGNKLYFGDDDSMVAEVIDNTTSRGRTLRFLYDGPHEEFKKALYALGETPLPHSIVNRPVEPEDEDRFQSIFAKHEGAVTAPTAGLHFSRELMKRMEIKGIDFAFITMHAGLGNFRDIDVEDLTKHKMDSEQMTVSDEAVRIVNKAKDENRNICAVGTTVMRAIESTVSTDGHLKTFEGWTNKFIFPPYEFTVANSMISNFHMPLSTLLMIVAAFGGYDFVMDAYQVALKEEYRFGTYGDAMLILDK